MRSALPPLAVLALTGCGAPMLATPPEIATGFDQLVAVDRKLATGLLVHEDFALGPYQVAAVKRSATKVDTRSAGNTTEEDRAGRYRFTLNGGPTPIAAICSTDDESMTAALGSGWSTGSSQHRVYCACGDANLFGSGMESAGNGVVRTREGQHRLVGLDQYVTEKNPDKPRRFAGPAAGYQFEGDGGTIAVVDLFMPGKAWLRSDLSAESRAEVACLAAGLMLYRPSTS